MHDLSHLSLFDCHSLAERRSNEIQTADELLGYKDGKTPVQRTHVLNRRPRVYGVQPTACDAAERCGVLCRTVEVPRSNSTQCQTAKKSVGQRSEFWQDTAGV